MEEDNKTLRSLLNGEWVDSEKVKKALGIDFAECMKRFDLSRTSEWWSIVGGTEEERSRNGMKVICKFRLKPFIPFD